ncbi:glycoside hydrolase family 13 protein [Miniimonas arenae]|uniref:glycoside hydrolase family 13 protein n=1 Tax=Miniimonas arenae TaxID=676201 RepID=UPI0028B081B0|nr:glycoside hydrolase family 13 protein [Miniimonas arenae]
MLNPASAAPGGAPAASGSTAAAAGSADASAVPATTAMLPAPASPAPVQPVHPGPDTDGGSLWWRDAVVYAVYPTSFADGNGDGVGDLVGLRERLPYIADLGVDAIWLCPWNPSPMVDGGYDVSDYRDINPLLGTLDDARDLVAVAHEAGLRIIVDLVANHTSDQHAWFRAALAAGPGSAERERYLFRDGRGEHGELPPNNWISAFGSSAWTRVREADGELGQWYLHTFAPEQPDLNWSSEEVQAEFDDIVAFWFSFGVDGLRIDAAPAMAKVAGLPDYDYAANGGEGVFASGVWTDSPHWDTPGVHDLLRRLRRVADSFGPDRMFVAESVVSSSARLADYLRPDELHTAFNFQFLREPWGPGLRTAIDATLATHAAVGAPPTWCLASHDEIRLPTRLGRDDTAAVHLVDPAVAPTDLDLGRRRARAAYLLMLALPGSAYVYQGEELGLPFVSDLPVESLRDPIYARSGGTTRGRDGSRVPMPWSGVAAPYGFTPGDAAPWLPMPEGWADLTVEAEARDAGSMLALVRDALRLRRALFGGDGYETHDGELASRVDVTWVEAPAGVLDLVRGDARCVVNLTGSPLDLDPDWQVRLTSVPLEGGRLPADATAWLSRA